MTDKWIKISLLLLALLVPRSAQSFEAEHLVVFGASLSDPGNAFALTGVSIKRPYSELDEFLVPPAPYKIGDNRFSNGATWVEQLGRRLRLGESTGAAFGDSAAAMNYAVGAARARDDGVNLNLPAQVAAFLSDLSFNAPVDALYVFDIGANDVRDALAAATAAEIEIILGDAIASIAAHVQMLYAAGARRFLILNTPDLSLLPSIRILDARHPGAAAFAALLSGIFNHHLDGVLAQLGVLPGAVITRLDVHAKVNEIVANPAQFNLLEVDLPCVTPDSPPFNCSKPDRYLFWDGVHPTRAVHKLFAEAAEESLITTGQLHRVRKSRK